MGPRNFQQANFYVSLSPSYKGRQAFNVGRERSRQAHVSFILPLINTRCTLLGTVKFRRCAGRDNNDDTSASITASIYYALTIHSALSHCFTHIISFDFIKLNERIPCVESTVFSSDYLSDSYI